MKVCVFVLSLVLAVADASAGSLRGYNSVVTNMSPEIGSNDAEGTVPEMKIERSDRLVVASKRVSRFRETSRGTMQMISFIQKHNRHLHTRPYV